MKLRPKNPNNKMHCLAKIDFEIQIKLKGTEAEKNKQQLAIQTLNKSKHQ